MVQVRLHAVDPADLHDRVLEARGLRVGRDRAVEDRDVLVDHDVDVRDVEPPLEGSEARSDAVGEHVVGHVGVGTPPREPVEDAGRARRPRSATSRLSRLREPARGAADLGVGRDGRDGSDRQSR